MPTLDRRVQRQLTARLLSEPIVVELSHLVLAAIVFFLLRNAVSVGLNVQIGRAHV